MTDPFSLILRSITKRAIQESGSSTLVLPSKSQVKTRSASSMWRHKNCTGNVLLEGRLEEDGALAAGNPSMDGTIGQRIHSMLEDRPPDDITYEEGQIADMCDMLAQMAEDQFFEGRTKWLKRIKEERFNYEIDGVVFFTGKPDRVSRLLTESADILNVNYKTGRKGSIEASENLQLRTEVVLIANEFDPEKVGAAIIEPLVTKKPEIVVYDRAAIAKAEAEILEIVDRTFWEDKRNAGPWCLHCPCRAHCPEARKYATDFPAVINVEALPRGPAGAELLSRLKTAATVIKAIGALYREIIEQVPDAVPGWWISPGDNIRVVDPQTMLGAMHEQGMTTLDFHKCVSFHIGKLKELWRLHSSKDFDETFVHTWTLKRKNGSLEPVPKRLKG